MSVKAYLIGLCVAYIGLAGCATKPITITEVETIEVPIYETVPVPEALLKACKVDLSALESNQDLERAVVEAVLCNEQHNADKAAIRDLE